ncbi:MAG: hypothetical protein L0I92_03640 [Staphylococcus equorum]|nr:hypothetical protein [Staphylococcus equorum]
MYNLGTSFELEDAIKDLSKLSQRSGLNIDDSIIPHLAMELVKAEQEYKKDKTLDHELTEMTNMLNYPYIPLIDSISNIGDAIEDLSESVAYLKDVDNHD